MKGHLSVKSDFSVSKIKILFKKLNSVGLATQQNHECGEAFL